MKKIIFISLLAVISILFMYADDGPGTWTQSLSSSGPIWGIAVAPSNQQVIYAASNTTGMWKSTNGGANWTQVNSGLSNLILQCVAVSKTNANIVMCGSTNTGSNPGVYRSTDGGNAWTRVVNGITETNINIQSVAIDPVNPSIAYVTLFDGTTNSTNGIYKTTDGGANWVPITSGIGAIKNFLCITINPLNPNVLYAGSSFDPLTSLGPAKIYKSVNGGTTWSDYSNGLPALTSDIKPIRVISISSSDTAVLLASQFMNTDTLGGGMYVTTNGGTLWQKRNNGLPVAVGMLPRSCMIRTGSSTEMYAGLGNGTNTTIGIYRSTNMGLSWSDFNNGLMNNTYTVRGIDMRVTGDSTIFLGVAHPTVAAGQGVFEYSLPLVGINDPSSNIPDKFSLSQNFPNPFNPQTTINFSVPQQSNIKMVVYNAEGKEIMLLLNKTMDRGNYSVTFDGTNLPSGIYFYELTAGDYKSVKKMILIK